MHSGGAAHFLIELAPAAIWFAAALALGLCVAALIRAGEGWAVGFRESVRYCFMASAGFAMGDAIFDRADIALDAGRAACLFAIWLVVGAVMFAWERR